MHMADALVSPAVGGTMWVVSGGLLAWCARKVRESARDNLVPLMGILGAFVFTAQMINFTIPGTGSSGHLGGGLLLAALLGPHAAFLALASILTIQALFFADGGLLALGCNMFNMGFFPAFVAYPLVYRVVARDGHLSGRAMGAAVLASVAGLLLGAFGVVLETSASGISELPFGTFVLMMLPIHLAIGIVEGVTTAAVVAFVARARPEAVFGHEGVGAANGSWRPVWIGLGAAALLTGGGLSWFASTHPDGLEWSVARVAGQEELEAPEGGMHQRLAAIQEAVAVLPDYGFKSPESAEESEDAEESAAAWPEISAGTSVSGVAGGFATLALVGLIGLALRGWRGSPRAA